MKLLNDDGIEAVHKGLTTNSHLSNLSDLSQLPIPRADEFLVVPLGGVQRIGMNWTLYGHAGRWILVDAGIGFPDRNNPQDGDVFCPAPDAILSLGKRLDGLIITHAHEDHIGGVHHFWPEVFSCPIYATPFASEVLKNRFSEHRVLDRVTIRTFKPGDTFDLGGFSIEAIAVTHSVPEAVALALTTNIGTMVHTGDWKDDQNPLVGHKMDWERLTEIGHKGVLALLCDSTNANRDLSLSSEADVLNGFRTLMQTRQGMVVVACFGSNVARVASACIAGAEAGRMVALAGRSIRTNEMIASNLRMLDHVPQPLFKPSHLFGLEKNEQVLICSGGQGEENAALTKLIAGSSSLPTLSAGDTVVISSRIIPGNEEAVQDLITKMEEMGVEVLTGGMLVSNNPLHVSGHAGANELRRLHKTLKPRFVIPLHGEATHVKAHADLALECGAEHAFIPHEGYLMSISNRVRYRGQLTNKPIGFYRDVQKSNDVVKSFTRP